ncbi:ABC transporter ATP-binding protein [Streptococcus hongkongensis]|nr:ABC transporter ATP-binding protein [Streptococcus uberis]
MTAIQISELHKAFGDTLILDNVSLDLVENQIYGFVGPNGAGKTTTIKMILGLTSCDSGSIKVFGQEVSFGHTKTNQIIGYLPDVPEFYDYMTATEYLQLCAGLSQSKHALDINELLQSVGLAGNRAKIGTFSRGMKQRLGLAQALIHDPKILICDEPTSALDPKGRQDILDIISSLRGKKTVIFSTHILSDVEKVCDHVLVLTKHGIYDLDALREAKAQDNITSQMRVLVKISVEEAQQLGKTLPVIKKDNHYQVTLEQADASQSSQVLEVFYQRLLELKIFPSYLDLVDNSLEDLYLEVIA